VSRGFKAGVARTAARALQPLGIDPYAIRRTRQARRTYAANREEFQRLLPSSQSASQFTFGRDLPCLSDRDEPAGEARGDYFHQDLLVARWVHDAKPVRHVDVGSRVDGFVAHVAAFRAIEVLDLRPLSTNAEGITFHQRDITRADDAWDECCDSLSCLHALEHFGLGRYGDPVDPDGWKRGWENLCRMVEPDGMFYFSTPIGPQRIEFDAHRVFSVPFLRDLVTKEFTIEEFCYVDDAGELHGPVDVFGDEAQHSFGCKLGCGIFALRRHR
jgi:hypothetical protein